MNTQEGGIKMIVKNKILQEKIRDYWLKEAERLGDEAHKYADWINANKEHLLEKYKETLDSEDIDEIVKILMMNG